MLLSFKPNVTCGPMPTRNLWFVNVFSTFRRQNSMVKMAFGRGAPDGGAPSHGKTGTMVNPALPARRYGERCKLPQRGPGGAPAAIAQLEYWGPRKGI